MSDENDKTLFKQPMPGGDRTSLRPAPGRRTGNTEFGRPRPGAAPAGADRPGYAGGGQAAPAPGGYAGGRAGYEMAKFSTMYGLNPLVNSASTLIAVFEKTRGAARHPDVASLHKRVVNEMRQFEQNAKESGVKPEILLAARYLLCSAIDEAVLHTPWGDQSAWGQRTLLSMFHGETSGGEKCFLILDRMLKAPGENIDMLELFYVVISLGFEGKYRVVHHGRDQLEALRDDLYRTIRTYRGDFERGLSPAWAGLGRVRKTLVHFIPMWVAVSVFAAICFFGYGGFSYWMRSVSNPVLTELQEIISPSEAKAKPSLEDTLNLDR